jgi:hypothetical protein
VCFRKEAVHIWYDRQLISGGVTLDSRKAVKGDRDSVEKQTEDLRQRKVASTKQLRMQ